MVLGVFIHLKEDIEAEFKKVNEMGFKTCQLSCWALNLMNEEYAQRVKKAAQKYDVTITAVWAGWSDWSGPAVWDFYEGPFTLGIVPPAYRHNRLLELCKGSDFAKMLGVTDVITHVGFIPENPATSEYMGVVAAVKHIANYCKNNGQYFLFETGQETPITLLRTIEEVGTENLGINLDPANFILYGKANPIDALTVIGKYVRNIHGKDGCYPTNGKSLGIEKPLGEGHVNYPLFIKKLKEIGYNGPITIEREISGEEQIKDILMAKKYLEELLEA